MAVVDSEHQYCNWGVYERHNSILYYTPTPGGTNTTIVIKTIYLLIIRITTGGGGGGGTAIEAGAGPTGGTGMGTGTRYTISEWKEHSRSFVMLKTILVFQEEQSPALLR